MEGLDVLVLISRWLHIGAAIVAVGGATYLCFALLPAAKATLNDEDHQRLREAVRARWAPFVHGSIAVLLLTGAFNFIRLAMPPKVDPMPYHGIFGIKFLAALGVFFIGTAMVGRSPAFAGMRKNARRSLGVLLSLAALIVLLSGVLGQIRLETASRAPTVKAVSPE